MQIVVQHTSRGHLAPRTSTLSGDAWHKGSVPGTRGRFPVDTLPLQQQCHASVLHINTPFSTVFQAPVLLYEKTIPLHDRSSCLAKLVTTMLTNDSHRSQMSCPKRELEKYYRHYYSYVANL